MLSEAKLAANRRNALRSTGPRTPEGKPRSASNSATHNLRSRKPLELTAEDHETIAQISRHFRPGACQQTPAEEAVLLDFATAVHIRTQVEHALDEAFCTNEPTVTPASHQYQSDTPAGHPGCIADAHRTAIQPSTASEKESAQAATASDPYPDKDRTESTDSQADMCSGHAPSSHPASPSDLYTDKISPRSRDGPPEGSSTKRFLQPRSIRRKQQRIETMPRVGEIAVPVGKPRRFPVFTSRMWETNR